MSYDYLIFRAAKNAPAEMSAIEEDNLAPLGSYSDVKSSILALHPQSQWNDAEKLGWLTNDVGRFEFIFYEQSVVMTSFSIRTSYSQNRNATQEFIETLCNALGLFAFDGQELTVFGYLTPETQQVVAKGGN